MRSILAVVLSLSLITGAVSVAATGSQPGLSLAAGEEHGDVQLPDNNTTDGNSSMGAQVSTFMQSSATDANASVDSGMWSAAYNGSKSNESKAALVTQRVNDIDARLAALEKKKQRLQDRKDEMNPVAYKAQLAAITSQLAAISEDINQTETRAEEVGVNTTKLEELRTNASDMAGPEVAAMARELAGNGPPEDIPGLGPDKGENQGADNETDGNSGPPDNTGNDNVTGNGTDGQGPPDDPGSGGGGGGNDGGNAPSVIADRIAARR
ncbi:hypothetical protein [Haloarchaeobius sp. HME9146]|uniref:hypothetical protein n=1 Tax=Haloarchaeobius sp. HME9146 TaxID=2978732 RepID=UPI0021BE8C92|nr:hypothetical protein [Haloarchaeobius sp. HME9146]MCT9097742.1 hypothetical protein [Haloarchaeobius sp. HME9146]